METIKHPTKHSLLPSVGSVITNKRCTPVMLVSRFGQTLKNLYSLVLGTKKENIFHYLILV